MALAALASGTVTVLVGLVLLGNRPQEQAGPAVTRVAVAAPSDPTGSPDPHTGPAPAEATPGIAPVPQGSQAAVVAAAKAAPPRPRPPRLRTTPSPPSLKVVDFGSLIRSQPQMAMALSNTARESRDRDLPGVMKCAASHAARRPDAVVDGELLGSVGFVLKVEGGKMRLAEVVAHKDSDATFARCFGQALGWAGQVMDTTGAADGTVTVEWPYSLTVER
jgi:hypothetical protein